jgi:outer membrane protein assembly factor BamB
VLYVARKKVLYVTALDAGSGSTVWTVRASPSEIAPGVAPILSVLGQEVIYIRTRGNRLADVAASDARTGRLLWHSPPGEFTGWPTICPDDQTEICPTGALVGHAPSLPLRFDARNGDAAASARAPYSGRELGPNLFDAGGRSPEHLVATRGTSILWTKRLSTIFAAGWASSDNGWNFERNDRLGLFVGSVGPRLLSHSGSRCTLDLSTMKTVAFAIRDGAVAWRRPGFFACGAAVACPGDPQHGFDAPIAPAAAAASVGVRLVLTGLFTGNGTSHPVLSPNARAVLQGFDPATGRTRWSFDAGRDPGLLTNEAPPPQVAHDAVVLRRSGRLFAVDLRDGATRALPATARA